MKAWPGYVGGSYCIQRHAESLNELEIRFLSTQCSLTLDTKVKCVMSCPVPGSKQCHTCIYMYTALWSNVMNMPAYMYFFVSKIKFTIQT